MTKVSLIENTKDNFLVGMFRNVIVQISDKGMKIGTHGNFGKLISKQSGSTIDLAQGGGGGGGWGRDLESNMADTENFNER